MFSLEDVSYEVTGFGLRFFGGENDGLVAIGDVANGSTELALEDKAVVGPQALGLGGMGSLLLEEGFHVFLGLLNEHRETTGSPLVKSPGEASFDVAGLNYVGFALENYQGEN